MVGWGWRGWGWGGGLKSDTNFLEKHHDIMMKGFHFSSMKTLVAPRWGGRGASRWWVVEWGWGGWGLPEGVSEVDAPSLELLGVVRGHVGEFPEDVQVRGVSC